MLAQWVDVHQVRQLHESPAEQELLDLFSNSLMAEAIRHGHLSSKGCRKLELSCLKMHCQLGRFLNP